MIKGQDLKTEQNNNGCFGQACTPHLAIHFCAHNTTPQSNAWPLPLCQALTADPLTYPYKEVETKKAGCNPNSCLHSVQTPMGSAIPNCAASAPG